MRRNGFTMVELIFVIIIIGILSVAAIPKFGDIKDRAKVNAEYSALSGLDGAIIAAMEFYAEDNNGDIGVLWHNQAGTDAADVAALTASYTAINTNKAVLKKIVKKSDTMKIERYLDMSATDADATNLNMKYDILFISGAASNSSSGVSTTTDVAGKPDKNDVWVFNGSPLDIKISSYIGGSVATTTIESGGLALIDIEAATTTATNYTAAVADSTDDISLTLDGGTSYETLVTVP